MNYFRGEEILHKKLRMPCDIQSAVRILEKIGRDEDDILQFIDLTENDIEARKSFSPLLQRCDDSIKKLKSIENFAKEFEIDFKNYSNFFDFNTTLMQTQQKLNMRYDEFFDYAENFIKEEHDKISEIYVSYNEIKQDLIIEMQRLTAYNKYFSLTTSGAIERQSLSLRNSLNNNMIDLNDSIDSVLKGGQLTQIVGVCPSKNIVKMSRAIQRVGRDRIFITFFDAEFSEDYPDKELQKIFLIFTPNADYLLSKIIKMCDVFGCVRFNIPGNVQENKNVILNDINDKISEQKNYLTESKRALKDILEEKLVTEKIYQLYKHYFLKMRMIYENLIKCVFRENFIDGEVWVRKEKFDKIKRELLIGEDDYTTANFIDVRDYGMQKPTIINTNEFTYPFQEIINQYGIPRYGEINPGYFTIVSFPFMFGIMFGDIGHGLILLCISLLLIYQKYKNKQFNGDVLMVKKSDSMLETVSQFRYFLLLMSIFSIFCGLLYNEFLSIPINFFGSCYENKEGNYIDKKHKNCVYPIGLDPIWQGKHNVLSFTNSFKMKFSVIFGIIQMTLGVVLKGLNELHYKKYISFFFEFIPELMFMLLFLGYIIFMIIFKWSVDWSEDTSKAPSILTILINFVIKFGSVEDKPLFNEVLGMKQETINRLIIITCLLIIPVMFFGKPILLYITKYMRQGVNYNRDRNLLDNENILNHSLDSAMYSISEQSVKSEDALYCEFYEENRLRYKEEKKRKSQLFELLIAQLIETIEFVLGCVSNTASYLRLWALSLAHTALTHTFLESTWLNMVHEDIGVFKGSFQMLFRFFLFGNITVFILLFMDALECLLHALRLHWVEFQDKFFKGDGYLFLPFTFKVLFKEENADS